MTNTPPHPTRVDKKRELHVRYENTLEKRYIDQQSSVARITQGNIFVEERPGIQ